MNKGKHSVIMNLDPKDYEIFDQRIRKPVSVVVDLEDSEELGTMVLQDTDEISIRGKKLDYFLPNNVGVLLSVSSKAFKRAQVIYEEKLNPANTTISLSEAKDKIPFLKAKSSDFCDYVEEIQTSIVFAYTALEAFANLSIPSNYHHIQKVHNKGIDERYDKKAIERWIDLETKLKTILTNIYGTPKIDKTKTWAYFKNLEDYRHNIIHQKSIEHTDFYKRYFKKDIANICNCSEAIIRFFYDQNKLNNTNPLWPWIVGKEKEFPIRKDKGENYEVVGNVYEGRTKKKK